MFSDLLNGNRKHRRGSSIACSAVGQPPFECEHAPRLCLQIWRPLRSWLHTSPSLLLLSPQTCRSSPPTGQHSCPLPSPCRVISLLLIYFNSFLIGPCYAVLLPHPSSSCLCLPLVGFTDVEHYTLAQRLLTVCLEFPTNLSSVICVHLKKLRDVQTADQTLFWSIFQRCSKCTLTFESAQ